MNNYKKDEKLFSEFPPVSTQEWEDKIRKDLKGADYDKKLIWKTDEGFNVRPYYRREDLEKYGVLNKFPEEFPFERGTKIKSNDWLIRQDIYVKDIRQANKKALDVLMKGVNSIGFVFNGNFEPTKDDLERVTENIFADAVEMNFVCQKNHRNVISYIDELVKKYNRNLDRVYGSVNYDPIGDFVLKGRFQTSENDAFDIGRKVIEGASDLPHYKVILINGQYFANSGASIVEQLAFSLAQGTNYLTQLTERGLSIDKVAPRLKFQFAVGGNYFMEIAKFRAARLLWANIVKAYGPSSDEVSSMHIHTVTSDWNKTIYDEYVNLLRTSTESMSSVLGGIDSLTINPFNSVYEEPTEFSERLARNQQLLLKEESYLDKVVDPGAGSYYIENLTNSLADQAWKLFLEVQENGGFIEAFKLGFIQNRIVETAQKRDMAIALRKESVLGTNQYPNNAEYIEGNIEPAVFEAIDRSLPNAIIVTLKQYRGAQAFEMLRYKTDQHAKLNRRPKVFLLTIGNLALRRARAQFAANFFGCAGFEIVDNTGFDSVEKAVAEFNKSNADIAVICSSDEEYAEYAPQVFEQLKENAIVVVAGYPKDIVDDLKKKGLEYFIHIKSNVLETLKHFQDLTLSVAN